MCKLFKTASVRCASAFLQSIHVKCTVPGCLVYSQSYTIITASSWNIFITPTSVNFHVFVNFPIYRLHFQFHSGVVRRDSLYDFSPLDVGSWFGGLRFVPGNVVCQEKVYSVPGECSLDVSCLVGPSLKSPVSLPSFCVVTPSICPYSTEYWGTEQRCLFLPSALPCRTMHFGVP